MSNLTKLLSRANTLARQGDLAAARTALEKATCDHPRKADPWISLAAIHGMGGNFGAALDSARKAVELDPASLLGWVNLANAAKSTGDLTQATEALRRACKLPDAQPHLLLELGQTLAQAGNWTEAVAPLQEYCRFQPGHREATLILASALSESRDPQQAVYLLETYIHQHPQDALVLTQLAYANLATESLEDAWKAADRALAIAPADIKVLTLRGTLLMHDARYEEARELFERSIKLQQNNEQNPGLYVLASKACRESGDLEAAEAYARTAVKLNPSGISGLSALCALLLNKNPAEARQVMEHAVEIAPDKATALLMKATVLEFEGNKQAAWDAVQEALRIGSIDFVVASTAASIAPDIGKTETAITLLTDLVENSKLAVGEQRRLHYALARLYDKSKQYDLAFEHARIANRLKNAWYDSNSCRIDLERTKIVYAQDSFSSLSRARNNSRLPLFIVGMPRSGTSLLEQILSCHSQVYARGETSDISNISSKIPYYPEGVRNLTTDKLDSIADPFLQHLRELDPSARRVTDKMPGNYFNLGLISQLLPGARIINCRRDPRDICLSQYMIEFGRGLTYTYDLESLACACRDYLDIMEHWKQVLPLPILDVRYEELIADPRTWVEKVLEFCGLEWEDACLNFHQSSRQVITASYDQVRRPLYKSSVARWKHYERHLEPISRILGLHGDTYL